GCHTPPVGLSLPGKGLRSRPRPSGWGRLSSLPTRYPRTNSTPHATHLTRVFGANSPPASLPPADRFDSNDVLPQFGHANPPDVFVPTALSFLPAYFAFGEPIPFATPI